MPIDRLIVSITESGWSSILTTGLIVVVVIAIIAVFALKYAKGSVYLELPGSSYSGGDEIKGCLLYTSPSPRDATLSRMPSSA